MLTLAIIVQSTEAGWGSWSDYFDHLLQQILALAFAAPRRRYL